jgi:hypothetical protein
MIRLFGEISCFIHCSNRQWNFLRTFCCVPWTATAAVPRVIAGQYANLAQSAWYKTIYSASARLSAYLALAIDSIDDQLQYLSFLLQPADVSMDRHTNQSYDHTSGTGGYQLQFVLERRLCMLLTWC